MWQSAKKGRTHMYKAPSETHAACNKCTFMSTHTCSSRPHWTTLKLYPSELFPFHHHHGISYMNIRNSLTFQFHNNEQYFTRQFLPLTINTGTIHSQTLQSTNVHRIINTMQFPLQFTLKIHGKLEQAAKLDPLWEEIAGCKILWIWRSEGRMRNE